MAARYIAVHALQAVPASLLNRGEDNEPKTLKIGNTTRTMLSSQSLKRPLRLDLEEQLDEHAARTRMVPLRVADALREAGWPNDLATFAGAQIALCASSEGLKTDPQQGGLTLAMLYLPRDVINDLTALCQEHRATLEAAATRQTTTTPQQVKGRRKKTDDIDAKPLPTREVAALLRQRTATINLFGRMLAEIPGANVEAAVQMAPAFTTHTSHPTPSFFTAVDDWPTPGASGSAHMQTEFLTTGVFYRYATVNLTELLHNLNGDQDQARQLLALFIESFILSLPKAKHTSTAPHTLPSLVHYAVRDRRPVSYAAAFDQPVKATQTGGHLQPSLHALSAHAAALNRLLGTRHLIAHGHATTNDTPADHLGNHHRSYDELIDACTAAAMTTAPQAAPA
ncbi:type I-E CRISPR-associated protein Cas7/Cse4/CasC [Streptomyces sp. MI02-7b]|uniref:type I-E CRISPR-associated protein Cas7/Cse4/CasC n=1 Tax=Streptomyces sp. MI02-7b TaxID=462941 RepID=UPI0029A94C21|nr:type I-E CRISPR-associated protein Cas7/Cse4/CasC [Streptomyces sp. MI02-7b]MDX3077861.1 type I-E CRISPR-associated protein Cas7/Cse4/CasC [Streptomyces sp. MI02-7b]